jgi:hypothetical protein
MKLPFTVEQFLEAFKNYNQSVYPMQIVFYLPGATVILFSIKKIANADRIINVILSFFAYGWALFITSFIFPNK